MHNGSKFQEAESSSAGQHKSRTTLLDFDKLAALATNDPEAFERYQKKLYQKAIEQAPIELQRRLKGMQFRINMARDHSNNGLSSCLKISAMMHDSLAELQLALANPQKYLSEQKNARLESAEIIPLFPNR